jgi:murein DD-endopeptidase MepM/ murein hydrolase activator NlpD
VGLVGSALACSEPAAVRREPAATHSAAPSSTTPTADTAQPSGPRFGLPVDATAISTKVGFDHDPTVQTTGFGSTMCQDYLGRAFPYCYDEHDGSDLILEGGFDAMDAGSLPVMAAQDGVVLETHDGEYDRCHIEAGTVSCDGYPMVGNQVTLRHADGWITKYWHLKNGSVAVAVGDEVACGDVLGLVGSSGYSSMPHVHFEVVDPGGVIVDPFAGPYSQEQSLWDEQLPEPILPGSGCTAR